MKRALGLILGFACGKSSCTRMLSGKRSTRSCVQPNMIQPGIAETYRAQAQEGQRRCNSTTTRLLCCDFLYQTLQRTKTLEPERTTQAAHKKCCNSKCSTMPHETSKQLNKTFQKTFIPEPLTLKSRLENSATTL